MEESIHWKTVVLQSPYAPPRELLNRQPNTAVTTIVCSSVPCPGVANSETLRRQTLGDTPANKAARNVPTMGRSLPVTHQPYWEIPAEQKVAIFKTFSDMFSRSPYEDFCLPGFLAFSVPSHRFGGFSLFWEEIFQKWPNPGTAWEIVSMYHMKLYGGSIGTCSVLRTPNPHQIHESTTRRFKFTLFIVSLSFFKCPGGPSVSRCYQDISGLRGVGYTQLMTIEMFTALATQRILITWVPWMLPNPPWTTCYHSSR